MKIIFAGTPAFAAITLDALIHSQHEIIAVYTQPDRPQGRGLKLKPSAVKELALRFQLPLQQPISLKEISEQEKLKNFNADVMVVAAYGLLLPPSILIAPKYGCINIHPSLLPRWRGAAPIARSIYAGDHITGVTIMQMDHGLDTGPILSQCQYVMGGDETSQTLHDKLAKIGVEALIATLNLLEKNQVRPLAQDAKLATYAHKISKEEALIDWTRPALILDQEIRAFNPWPVAYTSWHGKTLRIWKTKVIDNQSEISARTLVSANHNGIDIATGKGVLRLLEVQLPGGKVLNVTDFYNAKQAELIIGEHFI